MQEVVKAFAGTSRARAAACAVGLAVVTAGVGVLGAGFAVGQGDNLADFTWTMPSRFGHHVSGKRVLKYPQLAAEVTSGPFTVALVLPDGACEPGVERDWTVGGRTVEAERAGPGCAFRLEFERESDYELELHVEGNGHDDTSTQRVVVQDLLIVAIGDSVASGEGNPDNRSFIRPTWQDRRCHRSSFAGTALAAANAEAADPRSSVTFVHFACSGATVPVGLTGRYKGAQAGLIPRPRPRQLPPQLDELAEVAGKREVDAVLLSIGGNDVGFANIVSFCIAHANCKEGRIRENRLNLPSRSKVRLADAVKASLAQLRESYADLDAVLPKGLPPDRVYVLEYFDALHETADTFCGRILGGVSQDELRWAYTDVMAPLNDALRKAAEAHDWMYVSGVADAFAGHGYCASERWVRQLHESLWYQGLFNHKGTLHPNEEGHARTAELINGLLRPALFPGGDAREPLGRKEQNEQSSAVGVVPAELAERADTGDEQALESWALWVLGGAGVVAGSLFGAWALRRRRRENPAGPDVRGAEAAADRGSWFVIAQLARVGGALTLIGVALGLMLENEPNPGRAAVAGVLIAVAAILLILRPEDLRRLIERIERVKTPFGEALLRPLTEAAQEVQPEETDSDAPDDPKSRDMLELRHKLEAKIAYIAKHLLAEREPGPTAADPDRVKEHATYVTIGSLKHDGYLTENEALVATQVLTLTDDDLRGLPGREHRTFIAKADRIVRGIRASVFRAMVTKELERAGWTVEDDTLSASSGGRPDLEVRRGERFHRVVPVFATTSTSRILNNARNRLAEANQPELEQRILVVPDRPGSPTIGEHPRTVKLRGLPAALES